LPGGDAGCEPADIGRQTLRRVLLARYDALRAKLTQRLGSADLAGDALQDTWLRLERTGDVGAIRDPFAYLIRIASNLASNRRTVEQRRARLLEDQGEAELVDETPDPERIAAARSEWAAIKDALKVLPERRQAIFLAAWVEDMPHEEIAALHGVSVRTVQSEVKRAIEHCAMEVRKK
jgi:RNA polymerase sigma factor (sigma-70 family)